jgi:methylphosphotriester-DNA--protein-cysteine methyltransferase
LRARAELWDHDNEFDPDTWSMYFSDIDISHADDDSDNYSPPESNGSSSEQEGVPSWAVYVGSSKSDKYHKLDCYWASQINPENHRYFKSAADAVEQGYQPCKVCLKATSDEDESPSSPSKTYVGSRKSDKYHELSCYWANQIKPENRTYFSSRSEAESKGYVPCKVCKP